jgi:3-dehydroquinate synthase
MTVSHTLRVDLGDRSYPIIIGRSLFDGAVDLSGYMQGPDCLVVTNDVVGPLYADKLRPALGTTAVRTTTLADGEVHKTMATMTSILDELVAARAGRDATIVALGGGVVGDIAGFAAAVYMRGIDFIQVPTTLLSQVDSSVGGKTGVNLPAGKNLVGAFHQPRCVLIDTDTLTTLPGRELSAGLAEVIKHGAIVDVGFFGWLEQNIDALRARDADALAYAIARSCEIKAEVVADDERESGRRAILNFGHTFGHAIERCQGYGDWLHGEAVAAGMIMAARLSGLPAADVARLRDLVSRAGLPVEPPVIDRARMLAAMGHDKKASGRRLRFVLLRGLGDAFVTADFDAPRLDRILETAVDA